MQPVVQRFLTIWSILHPHIRYRLTSQSQVTSYHRSSDLEDPDQPVRKDRVETRSVFTWYQQRLAFEGQLLKHQPSTALDWHSDRCLQYVDGQEKLEKTKANTACSQLP